MFIVNFWGDYPVKAAKYDTKNPQLVAQHSAVASFE